MIGRVAAALRWRAHKAVNRWQPVVLMFHRVADIAADPFNLAVSPANFADQIAALAHARQIVPLHQLLTVKSDRPLAAITFDDGYRDVLSNALPVLEAHDSPAVLFLATGLIGSTRGFWWDELARLVLQSSLPPAAQLLHPLTQQPVPHTRLADAAARRLLHDELWLALRKLSANKRAVALATMAHSFGADSADYSSDAILSADEVASLSGSVIEIGAHTVTHASLPLLDPAAQAAEIGTSRSDCARLTGCAPRCFSYPFGDYDASSQQLVQQAGFELAVTSDPGLLRKGTSPWLIPRVAVGNWSADKLMSHIS